MLYSKRSQNNLRSQQRTAATGRWGDISGRRSGTWGEDIGPMAALDTPKGTPPLSARDALMKGMNAGEGEGRGQPDFGGTASANPSTSEMRAQDMTVGFVDSLGENMMSGALALGTNPMAIDVLGVGGALTTGAGMALGPAALGLNVADTALGYGLSTGRDMAFDSAIEGAFQSGDVAKGLQLSQEKEAMNASMGNKGLISQTTHSLGLLGKSVISPFTGGFMTPAEIEAAEYGEKKQKDLVDSLADIRSKDEDTSSLATGSLASSETAAEAAASSAEAEAKNAASIGGMYGGAKKALMDMMPTMPSYMDIERSLSEAAEEGNKQARASYSSGQKAQEALMGGIAASYGQDFADDVNAAMAPGLDMTRMSMLDPEAVDMANKIAAGQDVDVGPAPGDMTAAEAAAAAGKKAEDRARGYSFGRGLWGRDEGEGTGGRGNEGPSGNMGGNDARGGGPTGGSMHA